MATKKSGGGGKKQTSQSVSRIASRGLRGEPLTKAEIKKLAGSALSQDEKGSKPKRKH